MNLESQLHIKSIPQLGCKVIGKVRQGFSPFLQDLGRVIKYLIF